MPTLDHDGVALHVLLQGAAGPWVVMSHGLFVGSIATWYFGAGPALAQDHRVAMWDLRAHGHSAAPPTGYDLATQTDDLRAVLDQLGIARATLVGHSYGALASLRLAIESPERVARLVIVEAPLPPGRVEELEVLRGRTAEDMVRSLPEGLQAVVGQGGRRARRLIAHLHRLVSATTLVEDLGAEPDFDDAELAGIGVPTLLVYGSRSSCLSAGHRLARTLPCARLVTLDAGHFLPVERGSELVDLLRGFLG